MYSPKKQKIIVIGGNDAGLSAAGRAKRRNPRLEVVVLEKTPNCGYASCGLPYMISGQVSSDELRGPDPISIEQKRGFKVLVNHQAVRIDPLKRRVLVRNVLNDYESELDYDRLILATGAQPIVPQFAQVRADNLFHLRNFQDAQRLSAFIQKNNPQKALIIGAGYIGLEMAEAFIKLNMNVTVVEKEERIFPQFEKELSGQILKSINAAGLEFKLNKEVSELVVENNRIIGAKLVQDKALLAADLVFISTGIKPDVRLAVDAGIPLGATGAILVNKNQQTRRMDIFAAGDCCESVHVVTGKPVWMPFAGIASKQGRVAGDNVAGGHSTFPGVVGSAMVQVFGLEIANTGLSYTQAIEQGFDARLTTITHDAKPSYIRDHSKITVALVTDNSSKKVLGVQMFGREGVGHRLNVLATAIAAKLTVNDLAYLDFGYTPTINTIWDAVQVAASVALRK